MYTLQGKTRPTRHVRFPHQSTYARHMLPVGGPHTWQPFTSHRQDWMDTTTPEKKCSRLHLSARLSGPWDPLSISPKTAIEAVGLSQAPVDDRLLGLPGPYHRHAIGTFNTCSQIPTPTSLTDTGKGYHIKSLRIATTLSPPFPSEGSTDPPKWPRPVSIFIQH
jgi:hypothetical protein